MSEHYVVSPEQLRATAESYAKELLTVLEALARFTKAIKKLGEDYTGIAALAMVAKIIELIRNLHATTRRITDAMEELKLSADIYEAVEKANEALMQELQAGTSIA